MNDWERQQRLNEFERLQSEGNRALQESNRIEADKVKAVEAQNDLIAEQNRLLEQQRWDDERRRQREHEEQIEQGFRDRIFNLRTKIAEASDGYQEAKLQALLTEAVADEERYYEEKRRQEEEARIRAEQLRQEQLIRQQVEEKLRRRRKIIQLVGRTVLALLALFALFIAWGFWSRSQKQAGSSTLSGLFADKQTRTSTTTSSSSAGNKRRALTPEQNKALEAYMLDLGQVMNQTYRVVNRDTDTMTQATEVAYYAQKSDAQPTIKTMAWYDESADITLLAGYDQTDNSEPNLLPIHYRFALVDGQPLVLLVQREAQYHQFAHPQTGVILLPLHPTENQNLQSAFEAIMAGQEPASTVVAPYTESEPSNPHAFTVDVTVSDLNIRQEPSTTARVVRTIPQGAYTIVETKESDGHTWGRLSSGEGWISLTAIGRATLGAEAPSASGSGRLAVSSVPVVKVITVSDKNTKDLTTQEVADWAKAMSHKNRASFAGTTALESMSVDVRMADDGLVYADLTATGFSFVDNYRINQDGHLELLTTDGKGDWQVVSEVYTYIQP